MKHFVTLAALLTSLSAVAQLPYNPDANGDGLIGAFDLTSLLSLYSGNFSNGVLGEGAAMASMEFVEDGFGGGVYFFQCNGYQASSFVIDLSLVDLSQYGGFDYPAIEILWESVYNGATLIFLRPTNWGHPYTFPICSILDESTAFCGSLGGFDSYLGRCDKLVFWNGEWLPLTGPVSYSPDS